MRSPWRRGMLPAIAAAIVACAAGWSQESGPASPLDSVRRDLEELRFERALAAIELFLADPGVSEEERVAALILRGQAHVAYGDLDAAERDYADLLALRPAYEPEASLVPPKALARFAKVRDRLVGTVVLTLRPRDARVRIDGREAVVPPDGVLRLLAGERLLQAERAGFDPGEAPVPVPAGGSVEMRLELVPNARTLVIQTEPEGVTVSIDGVPVGTTARPEAQEAGSQAPARLMVENVALGEHLFELGKPCHRTVSYQEIVTVDLADVSARVYPPVTLEPVRSRLALRGAPEEVEVRVDGEAARPAAAEGIIEVCPGERIITLRWRDRTLWRSRERFAVDGEVVLAVRARPNVVLLGSESWPAGLEAWAETVNLLATLPEAEAPASPDDWERLGLPSDADLVVAAPPAASPGRWLLYSPHLRAVRELRAAEPGVGPPAWSVALFGMHLADSRVGGPARVVAVDPGGPAAAGGIAPAERLVAVGSTAVSSAATARGLLAAQPPGAAVVVGVEGPGGERREVTLRGARSPRLLEAKERSPDRAAWLAAWAAADGLGPDAESAPAALANLALLLEDAGRPASALEAWRRVRLGPGRSILEGTIAYFVGRGLESLGREREAREAYVVASRGTSSTWTEPEPAVAPAAADHLADLGVATER